MKAVEQDVYDAKMAAMTLPKRGICIVDDETAIMDRVYFEEMAEYSCSMPTGVFLGKRWKRDDTAYNHLRGKPPEPPHWVMGEYVKSDDLKMAATKWREVIVL